MRISFKKKQAAEKDIRMGMKSTGTLTRVTTGPKAILTRSMQKVDKAGKPIGKPIVSKGVNMKREPITAKQFEGAVKEKRQPNRTEGPIKSKNKMSTPTGKPNSYKSKKTIGPVTGYRKGDK